MQVKEPSFTGSARRAQIVDATLSVIAEQGYDNASYARIAEQAGRSSPRLSSYNFAGTADLTSGGCPAGLHHGDNQVHR